MKNTRNLELRHRRHTSFKTRLIRIFMNFSNLLDIDRLHMTFLERYASQSFLFLLLVVGDGDGRQDKLKLKWIVVGDGGVCLHDAAVADRHHGHGPVMRDTCHTVTSVTLAVAPWHLHPGLWHSSQLLVTPSSRDVIANNKQKPDNEVKLQP